MDVHGASAHGAVPSTNASSGDTNVTDVAANPAGTGPPGRGVVTAVGPAWVGDGAGADELAAERAGVLAAVPPGAAGVDAPTTVEPHPAMLTAASAASTPSQRDVRMPTNSLLLRTKTPQQRFGWAGRARKSRVWLREPPRPNRLDGT
jgi:hypothetical protein